MQNSKRSIVLCTTCKFAPEAKVGPDGRTGGEALVQHVRDALQSANRTDVDIEKQACLWNCTRHCSVAFRDEKRFSYITGGHEPSREQAEAIIQWFDAHGATDRGEVPFKSWPPRMKGHFIARIPPFEAT